MTRVCAVALWAAVALAHAPSGGRGQAAAQPDPIATGFGAGAYPLGAAHPSISKIVKPPYPKAAMETGAEGEVLLDAVVGADGSVTDVRVVKAINTDLVDAAVAAVRQWKFKPASIQGRKVAAVVAPRVTFYLKEPGKRNGKPFVEAGLRSPADLPFVDVPDADAPGITQPTLVRHVAPQYTSEAMRQKIQGVVVLDAIIGIDGRITAVRVARSLDRRFGLDQAALAAAQQWTFTPARRIGVPIAVKVQLHLEFRLH
jgi:TonB family protein